MRPLLMLLFSGILACMLYVTTAASLEVGVLDGARKLWPDAWFRATLADAYFGFVTVFVWIASRERTLLARVAWFVLLMTLGNIAISAYVLIALFRLKPEEPLSALLQPKPAVGARA